MRNLKLHRYLTVVFFLGCGLFVTYCVYYLVNPPSSPHSAPAITASAKVQKAKTSADCVFVRGQANAVDNLELRYVGLEKDIILIDVTIVDLDPEYAYRHRIPKKSARNGFQVAGKSFKLLSVNDSVLKLATS